MKFLKTYAMLVTALIHSALWAGPSVGGGGDVIILPDDSVVLADPFIDSGAPQPNNMPPLRALNPRILQVINLYQKVAAPIVTDFAIKGKSDINEVLAKLSIRNNDLRFYGVQNAEELNQFCAPGGRKIYKLPNGAQVQQVACTAGNETFMVEPLFMRLSLRDQGLLLIHERLTTLRDQYGGKNYSAIARFTSGLNVYLTLLNEQNKKKFRALSIDEQKLLTDFFVATEEIEKRNSDVTDDSFQWVAHQNGGGRVHTSASIDESAFVSLNSVIARGSDIGRNVKVMNFSNPYRIPLKMEDGAEVYGLFNTFGGRYYPTAKSVIVIKMNTKMTNVKLSNNIDQFVFGENSTITDSVIDSAAFTTGLGAIIQDSSIDTTYLRLGDNVAMKNATVSYSALNTKIASGEQLIDKSILQSTYEAYYPLGFIPRPLDVVVTASGVLCTQTEKRDSKNMVWKKEILDANKDGAIIDGELALFSQTGVFKREYTYSYDKVKLRLIYKNFTKDTNKSLFMINDEGRIVNPDYRREVMVVDLGGLSDCERRWMQTAAKDFINKNNNTIALRPGNDN